MDKRFLGILAALIIIFGGIFIISQKSSDGSSGGGSSGKGQPTSHIEGQNSKNVTLVEYGDYECPICTEYYQPLKDALTPQILQQIHFQFRNLPLTQIHQNAFAGARAAEAAGMQNKYWQMHDLLYENNQYEQQAGWVVSNNPLDDYFTGYAKQLGLNVTKFKSDYGSSTANDSINADINAFLNTSYANHDTSKEATPTFFLNGKYLDNTEFSDPSTGLPSAAKITQVIQSAINKQSSKSQ